MRTYNFSAGPAMLPTSVMEKAQSEFCNYHGTGCSIVEISHRGKEFSEVINRAETNIRELLNISNDYMICFLQGGASLQFGMIPMNLMLPGGFAEFIDTGAWAGKAMKEAKLFGDVKVLASSKDRNYTYIPHTNDWLGSSNLAASYMHITSNETIQGTQWRDFPDAQVPLIADMSSDILSRRFNINQFGLVYAGAQKNLGPSGSTLVIIRKDLLERASKNLTTMLRYETQLKEPSLYNTPCTFSIYIIALVTDWLKEQGGLKAIEAVNDAKSEALYETIDNSGGFYNCPNLPEARSRMNVVFRLPTEELEQKFIKEATTEGMSGLKGHRSVGGLRASIYNAMPLKGVETLIDFMDEFKRNNG